MAAVMATVSCASDDSITPAADKHPIAFVTDMADEEVVARSTTLGHDFVVYGYKRVGGAEQTVFDGYTVQYRQGTAATSEDNSRDYYYVCGEQSIKYWDFAATEYHFWGLWRETTDLASFTEAKHNVLTIHNVPLRVGEPAPEDNVLYSALSVRCPVSGDVVSLDFKRPYAKLCIQFYTNDPLSPGDQIDISGITFAPDPEATDPLVHSVYAKGDVRVTYPLTTDDCGGDGRERVEVLNLGLPRTALNFEAVRLDYNQSLGISSNTAVTAPIDESEGFSLQDMGGASLKSRSARAGEIPGKKYYYYPLPMGDRNPNFVLSILVDGDPKTAVVPSTFMQWRPNCSYTYIFKITEAGKKVELYDVKIAPWQYGGSQEDTWNNW